MDSKSNHPAGAIMVDCQAATAEISLVFAAKRLHGDDTTVPVLAKDETVIGRL